jgi:hypothetical protein
LALVMVWLASAVFVVIAVSVCLSEQALRMSAALTAVVIKVLRI